MTGGGYKGMTGRKDRSKKRDIPYNPAHPIGHTQRKRGYPDIFYLILSLSKYLSRQGKKSKFPN